MQAAPDSPRWQELTAEYQKPDTLRSVWQLVNTVIPYVILWYLMYRSLEVSYWLTLTLAVPASGFLVRTFIIFHDCCHGSFLQSKRATDIVGFLTGVLTFTPYDRWRREHSMHHATAGDLDRRDLGGEIWTLTVDEYRAAPLRTRIAYRLYRSPWVMLTVGPSFLFLFKHRFSDRAARRRERLNVYWTNLGSAALVALLIWLMGLRAYLMIQLPIMIFGGAVAVWLFYVQHQYEGVYWDRHDQWDYSMAAIEGSSFYELPRILHWFTGNIGYHHIHHLSPRIPNYFLRKCHEENPALAPTRPLTMLCSLKSLRLRLWDEENRQMVGFRYLREQHDAQ
jgi:omega-6 fatty acid desaturase (delta-12 desaturase)